MYFNMQDEVNISWDDKFRKMKRIISLYAKDKYKKDKYATIKKIMIK